MKDIWLYTILFTLLSGLIFMPFGGIQGDNGNGNSGITNPGVGNGHLDTGNGLKKGHTNYKGKGLGHVKHHSTVCPTCGGNPCTPPCDGGGGV